jgi:hypothetical protein
MKKKKRTVGLKRSLSYYEHPDTRRPYQAVTLEMGRHYWKFFKEAQVTSGDHVAQFEAGLKTVVWGALCLETLLNDNCARALARLLKSGWEASAIWEAMRKTGWTYKLEMLGRLASRPRRLIETMQGRYHSVIGLRNRLVHFYDRPTPINRRKLANKSGKLSPVGFFEELYPPTAIEKELLGNTLIRFRKNVALLRQWIDRTIPAVIAGRKVTPRQEVRWLESALKDVASVEGPPTPPSP